MNKGDTINGYRILQDFSTAGGGLSKWSFAERAGREFFIKEFLAPTYPTADAPGSEATKRRKRERCEEFERHHAALQGAVRDACGEGGNLVFARDFFRAEAKYYKVTDKVNVSTLGTTDISRLPLEGRLLILKTVAHSLQILHNANIVHGDLKPDNILIKATATGHYTSKLIDFDNSYFSGRPPARADEVVGDMVYYSPELAGYVQGNLTVPADKLMTASDIFALGIIYCQYLTGRQPGFDVKRFQYACEAVRGGTRLEVPEVGALPPGLTGLVREMLEVRSEARPGVRDVFIRLKAITPEPVPSPAPAGGMRIRMGTSKKATVEPAVAEVAGPASEEGGGSKLRGKLLGKTK